MFPFSRLTIFASLTFTTALGLVATAKSQDTHIALAESGFPALSREWKGEDYARAVEMIESGKVALPTVKNPMGSRILDRITAAENLAFHTNCKIPIEDRVPGFMATQSSFWKLLARYVNAANKGAKLNRELALLFRAQLRITAIGMQLVAEFIPTILRDGNYEARMKGVQQVERGALTVFSGAEVTLGERAYYEPADLSIVLEGMADALPNVLRVFPADYRAEMRRKLAKRKAEFKEPADQARLDEMLQKLAE